MPWSQMSEMVWFSVGEEGINGAAERLAHVAQQYFDETA